jgi:DoxX-like family
MNDLQAQSAPTKTQRILGHVLSSAVALMLCASAAGKLMRADGVIKGFAEMSIPNSLIMPIGVIEIVSAILSVIPKTRFWGVILITGYMGGAVITHMRMGQPPIAQIVIGVVAWVGLALRDMRVRDLALNSPGTES